jgi:hypothetical protein
MRASIGAVLLVIACSTPVLVIAGPAAVSGLWLVITAKS